MPYEPKTFTIAGQQVTLESTTGTRMSGGHRDELNFAVHCKDDYLRNIIILRLADMGDIRLTNKEDVFYTKDTDRLRGGRHEVFSPIKNEDDPVGIKNAETLLTLMQIQTKALGTVEALKTAMARNRQKS